MIPVLQATERPLDLEVGSGSGSMVFSSSDWSLDLLITMQGFDRILQFMNNLQVGSGFWVRSTKLHLRK